MQIAETIAIGMLPEEIAAKCPFKDDAPLGANEEDSENVANDDTPDAQLEQESSGGTLGRNLAAGSSGKPGTIEGPCPPPKVASALRIDTTRSGGVLKIRVPGAVDIDTGDYGFTCAAHHLIPGDASLEPSDLKTLMTKGASVEVLTTLGPKKKTIRRHIGYNVNGAHNGVWLPGNYYIRAGRSPIPAMSWSDFETHPWCLNYVAAASKVAGGQFHDTHTEYSGAVKKLLNKIAQILMIHECAECQGSEINPPFAIKQRLYNLSIYFKSQMIAPPGSWKRPWFASDRWRDVAFSNGTIKKEFVDAYLKADHVVSV
jgi:hypothetical protein